MTVDLLLPIANGRLSCSTVKFSPVSPCADICNATQKHGYNIVSYRTHEDACFRTGPTLLHTGPISLIPPRSAISWIPLHLGIHCFQIPLSCRSGRAQNNVAMYHIGMPRLAIHIASSLFASSYRPTPAFPRLLAIDMS